MNYEFVFYVSFLSKFVFFFFHFDNENKNKSPKDEISAIMTINRNFELQKLISWSLTQKYPAFFVFAHHSFFTVDKTIDFSKFEEKNWLNLVIIECINHKFIILRFCYKNIFVSSIFRLQLLRIRCWIALNWQLYSELFRYTNFVPKNNHSKFEL